ncbi:protein phosphatase 2C domain-containing protein [Halopseudomonas pachastrellae]|nr:protein phosphatase 2C domain-containing protein [Halopseudomonas pachastrellae]
MHWLPRPLQALALDYYATPETWVVPQALDKLLTAHNRWLRANGGGQPLLTTLTALVLRGRRYFLAHVGDCRAYLLRDGQLRKLTQDHVWEHPGMDHVLKRAMGLDEHLLIDYSDGALHLHDQLLIVSDGVWATLNDADLLACLLQAPFEQRCQQLLKLALQRAARITRAPFWSGLTHCPTARWAKPWPRWMNVRCRRVCMQASRSRAGIWSACAPNRVNRWFTGCATHCSKPGC